MIGFRKGTPVLIGDDLYKNIEDIKKDDTVISYNEETHELVPQKCVKAFTQECDNVTTYTFDNGTVLVGCDDLMFLTPNGYKEHLEVGDKVITINGEATLLSLEQENGIETLYELDIEEIDNYIVKDIVIHNAAVAGLTVNIYIQLDSSSDDTSVYYQTATAVDGTWSTISGPISTSSATKIGSCSTTSIGDKYLYVRFYRSNSTTSSLYWYQSAYIQSGGSQWSTGSPASNDIIGFSAMGSTTGIENDTYSVKIKNGANPVGQTYAFNYTTKSSISGLWPSNTGVHNSFSYGRYDFYCSRVSNLTLDIKYACESVSFDCGLISNLDTSLDKSSTIDSTYKAKLGGTTTTTSTTVTFAQIAAGHHHITFKYRKDGSVNSGIDAMVITNISLKPVYEITFKDAFDNSTLGSSGWYSSMPNYPTGMTHAGYNFLTWSTSSTSAGTILFNKPVAVGSTLTSDKTLYAIWTKTTTKLKCDKNKRSSSNSDTSYLKHTPLSNVSAPTSDAKTYDSIILKNSNSFPVQYYRNSTGYFPLIAPNSTYSVTGLSASTTYSFKYRAWYGDMYKDSSSVNISTSAKQLITGASSFELSDESKGGTLYIANPNPVTVTVVIDGWFISTSSKTYSDGDEDIWQQVYLTISPNSGESLIIMTEHLDEEVNSASFDWHLTASGWTDSPQDTTEY